MEERRIVVSVLIFCLVVGMLAGQSIARKSAFDQCYDDCFYSCLAISVVSSNLRGICPGCSDRCELKINGKACIFFWCWNVKRK